MDWTIGRESMGWAGNESAVVRTRKKSEFSTELPLSPQP